MGQEIVYCARCLCRLTTSDFEKGLGTRVGNTVACTDCLPAVVATLTPAEQQEFARQLTARRGGARQGSSAKHPRMKATTTRLSSPQATRKRWLLPAAAGAAVLLVGAIFVLTSGSPPPAPPLPPPKPPPDDRSAREAAERAKKAKEVDAQLAAMAREVVELGAQARPLVEREEYRAAIDLYERARPRRADREWRDLIDVRVRDIRKAADTLYATLRQRAGDARLKRTEEEVKAVRDRVARWRLSDLAEDLEKHLAGLVPPERPWTPVFDGKTTGFMMAQARPAWEVRDGALIRLADNAAQTTREFDDGQLRIRFEATGAEMIWFVMRQAAAEGWYVGWNTAAFHPFEGKACELIFTCRGEVVTATLNGQPLPLEARGKPRKGLLQFNGRAKALKYLSIDYRE